MTSPPLPAAAGLALQGGSAHGAYGWGVLDALLERGLRPQAISGVSAGALNGVALAQGWANGGGPAGARAELRRLWTRIGGHGASWGQTGGAHLPSWGAELGDLALQGLQAASRLWGSIDVMPSWGQDQLRAIVGDVLDPSRLRAPDAPPVRIHATDAETGAAVPFANAEITVDALLASCCLPFLFPAVRIGGRAFWDGGYSGNPPLGPLLGGTDIVLVRAQPRTRPGVPDGAAAITNRVQEIAFAGVLAAEIAALPASVRLHDVDAEPLAALPPASRLDTTPRSLERLFRMGRDRVLQ